MIEHFNGPIFVVPHAQKAFGPQQTGRVEMRVAVRDIGDVVALLLHPIGQGKFPQQPFSRPQRQRSVENLAVFAVRAIETDQHVAPPIPLAVTIVVERELIGPAIVGLPGVIAALEQKIGLPIVAHDEDHVALQTAVQGGQLAEIDTAQPIGRNRQLGRRLPLAVAQPFRADLGLRLGSAGKLAQLLDQPPAVTAVVTGAKNVERKFRRRVGADEKLDRVASLRAGVRAITFDPRRAVTRFRLDLYLVEHPGPRAGALFSSVTRLLPADRRGPRSGRPGSRRRSPPLRRETPGG